MTKSPFDIYCRTSLSVLVADDKLGDKYAELVGKGLTALSKFDWVRETLAAVRVAVVPWFNGNCPDYAVGVTKHGLDHSHDLLVAAFLGEEWLLTLAHELRHVWQRSVAMEDHAEECKRPYWDRSYERDARSAEQQVIENVDQALLDEIDADARKLDAEMVTELLRQRLAEAAATPTHDEI